MDRALTCTGGTSPLTDHGAHWMAVFEPDGVSILSPTELARVKMLEG